MTSTTRLATPKDLAAIQAFIKENWSSEHIFVVDNAFFRYEMCTDDVPNFVVSEISGKIVGLVGFIYNQDELADSEIFLVMFRVLKVEGSPALGIELIKYIQGLTRRGVHTVGANNRVLVYYRFLGFKTGYLRHYYWLSNDRSAREDFSLKNETVDCSFNMKPIKEKSLAVEISQDDIVSIVNNVDVAALHTHIKSKSFFLKRFAAHPIYNYKFFRMPRFRDIIVIREANANSHRVWRIVDFYGADKNFPTLCAELLKLAQSQSIAFVDLYVSGITDTEVRKSGLSSISNNFVIPNYLEPLVMKNISISYVTSHPHEPIFFRGDCDQDRPSLAR